jgi:hypothetical protein
MRPVPTAVGFVSAWNGRTLLDTGASSKPDVNDLSLGFHSLYRLRLDLPPTRDNLESPVMRKGFSDEEDEA